MPFGGASAVKSTMHGHKQFKAAKRALCPFINTTLIDVANQGDVSVLFRTVERFLPDMNLVNMTTSLHRVAKACSEDVNAKQCLVIQENQQVLQDLLERIAEALLRSEPGLSDSRRQAISNIVWSLGTLQCVQLKLIRVTAHIAFGQLNLFKPFELISTVWAFAKLGALHAGVRELVMPLQQAAVAPMTAVVSRLGFRFLAMGAWALAASGLSKEPLMCKIAGRILPMLRGADCCTDVLSDVAWAFSAAGFRHERILLEVSERVARDFSRFQPANLAQLCQLFASEGVASQDFMESCAQRLGMTKRPPVHVVPHAPARPVAAVASAALTSQPQPQPARPTQLSLAGMTQTPEAVKSDAFRGTGSTAVAEEDHAGSESESDWSNDDEDDDFDQETKAPSKASSPSTSTISPATAGTRRRSWADVTSDSEDEDEDEETALAADSSPESLPAVKFCVKNTFLELEDGDLTDEEESVLRRLPEPLSFARASIDVAELNVFRVRYQLCRVI